MDQNNVLVEYLLEILEDDFGVNVREKIVNDYKDALIEEEQKEILLSALSEHEKTKLVEEKFAKLLKNDK